MKLPATTGRAVAEVRRLQSAIDHAYETGATEGVESMEARLEALLDDLESHAVGTDEGGEDDLDDAWLDPASQLLELRFRYARHRSDGETFADFIRGAFNGEGPWHLRLRLTDRQILRAADDALAAYTRRWRAMRLPSLFRPLAIPTHATA